MTIGIYKISNRQTGDIYIGSSAKSIEKRWEYHIKDLKSNRHHSSRLQNSWNKYGKDLFDFSILEQCPVETCIEREQYYIDKFNPSFNMNPTAGNCLGRILSEKSKLKMSKSAKKRGINEFLKKQQISNAIFNEFGQKKCFKCLEFKTVNTCRFKTCNQCDDCYSKFRKSRKALINKTRKPVIAINETEILEFSSVKDAEIFFKAKGLAFNRVSLRHKIKSEEIYYNFKWSFKCP